MTKTEPKVLRSRGEPLVHIAKRDSVSIGKKILIRAAAILCAMILNAVFIVIVTKLNPFEVYARIFAASFSRPMLFMQLLRDLTSLLCIGVALAPAFKMRFWNNGAEGQVLMGGFATALCMIYLGGKIPTGLLFLAMIVTSVLAGAVWGLIPAFFKANWNTNETLFTLMMNYVAIQIVAYTVNILRGERASVGSINQAGWFPNIWGYNYTLNILIVAVLTVLMYIYLRSTKHGYEIAVVGESERTAKYAGINVKRVTMRTMLISGALCGLCGLILVAGDKHTLATNTAGGNGFTAIIVAWLAKFNTFYMALISFLLVFLEKGAREIASAYALNEYIAGIISGMILFFILGSEFFIQYRLVPRRRSDKADQNGKGGAEE
ncbi:MAG: ABC transporter permease [Clostridia bacterium]|nr:ABC transporter permease [Clostridia bacterium]